MISMFSIARILLYVSVFAMFLVSTSTLFPFIVGKYVFFRTVILLAFTFFLAGVFFEEKAAEYLSRVRLLFKSPLVIAITFWTVIFLLSGFFGVNPSFSFWSNFERGEGGFQLLVLYLFFMLMLVLFRKEIHLKILLGCATVAAVLVVGYGLSAHWGFRGFIGKPISVERFFGSIGNPAYLAAYLIFSMAYAAYFFKNFRQRKLLSFRNILIFLLIGFFAFFFFSAGTRGAFLGLGAAVVGALAYLGFSVKRLRKMFIVLGMLFVLLLATFITFRNSNFVRSIPGSRIFDISLDAQTLQTRFFIWNISLQGFYDRPLFGWGQENYPIVFDRHFQPEGYTPGTDFGVWYDRAHSVIFDTLAANGILGLLSYSAVFVVYYIEFFRKRSKSARRLVEETFIFALPFAYLVQGLVLFDVFSIYINVYIMLAFAVLQYGYWSEKEVKTQGK